MSVKVKDEFIFYPDSLRPQLLLHRSADESQMLVKRGDQSPVLRLLLQGQGQGQRSKLKSAKFLKICVAISV